MEQSKPQWQSDTEKPTKYLVHTVKVGDVEDPDVMVAFPLSAWLDTDAGKYVTENSNPKPIWYRGVVTDSYHIEYHVYAYFTPKQITYFKLKFE
jgi:hypothetical protein